VLSGIHPASLQWDCRAPFQAQDHNDQFQRSQRERDQEAVNPSRTIAQNQTHEANSSAQDTAWGQAPMTEMQSRVAKIAVELGLLPKSHPLNFIAKQPAEHFEVDAELDDKRIRETLPLVARDHGAHFLSSADASNPRPRETAEARHERANADIAARRKDQPHKKRNAIPLRIPQSAEEARAVAKLNTGLKLAWAANDYSIPGIAKESK